MFAKPLFDIIRPIPALAWIPPYDPMVRHRLLVQGRHHLFAAFISATINSYAGIKRTSQVHLWVASTFGATNMQMLFKVAIPTALPMIFTGLRLALGSSWVALVAAELLLAATRGLGYMIQVARMLGRPDVIIVGMITIGVVGYLLSTILEWFQNKICKRMEKVNGTKSVLPPLLRNISLCDYDCHRILLSSDHMGNVARFTKASMFLPPASQILYKFLKASPVPIGKHTMPYHIGMALPGRCCVFHCHCNW